MHRLTRRQLAKNLTAGVAACAAPASLAWQPEPPLVAPDLTWIAVHPGVWKARLGRPEAHTPVSDRLIPTAIDRLHQLPHVTAPPLRPPRGRLTSRGCLLSLPLASGEQVYGFGLQLLSLDQRGKKRTIRVNADPKGDSGDSHAPVPFFVTTSGYGILVDTFRQAEFFCGDAHLAPTGAAVAQNASVNTPEDTQNRASGQPGTVFIEVPRASGVDVFLFAGPSPLHAVQRYNLFSGGGVVPPEWGLGFWYRAELHADQTILLALAREYRDREIPCDVLGLEPGWQTHAYSCSFAWNPERFPNPKNFIQSAADLGYRINLWEHAFTHPSSPIFEAVLPHAGDFAVWEGLVPDFAAEPARAGFGNYHRQELIDAGVSGFKLDECDGSDFTGGWSFPDMSRFPSGLDGEQMHAAFGLRYQHTLWKPFLDKGQRTYSLVRSSGALAAPYPFVLYSDLYDHRQFVRGITTAGFSGLLWCPEVRDAITEEDLIRRLQTAVFSPLAMVNAWYIKNPPWKQLDRDLNNQGHLLENWHALEARCREIIGWRMQLTPYLRAAFEQYALDGTPPFRALALDYPAETALHAVDDEFLIGDRMLVAPLFAGEPGRDVRFPPGDWHDLWTGALVPPGGKLHVDASTETIPVFVKAGTVLPLAAVSNSTDAAASRDLTVRIFGDGQLPFRISSGAGVELELSWNRTAQKGLVRQPKSLQRPYRVTAWRQADS